MPKTTKVIPRATKFMDRYGYMRKELMGRMESRRAIRRMEIEIKDYLAEGATVAEAVYCILGLLEVAAGNVRFEMVPKRDRG